MSIFEEYGAFKGNRHTFRGGNFCQNYFLSPSEKGSTLNRKNLLPLTEVVCSKYTLFVLSLEVPQ